MGRKALKFVLAALLLLPVAAVAQSTVGLTGNFSDISGGATPGLQIQFLLAGCGANLPRITGHFGIVNTQYNFTPNATTGLLTGNIWPNDVITCGLVTGSTQYLVSFLVNNIPQGPATCFQITSSENPFDLTSQTPCNVTSVPPPPTPPLDAVFHNINATGFFSGTNGSFSGSLTAASFHFAATPSPCGSGFYSTGPNINFGPVCVALPTPPTVVTSFNIRQNAVVPVTGDYTCSMVTGAICSLPTFHYQTVQNNGTSQTQRSKLNLIPGTGGITLSIADNSGNDSTDVTVNAPAISTTLTNFDWSFTTCANMTGQPSQCLGSTTLPGAMPDASYQLFCQTNSGGTEPSDQVIVFHVATPLPTASGSTLNYAMIQIFQNGTLGGVTVTAMCHAHHN